MRPMKHNYYIPHSGAGYEGKAGVFQMSRLALSFDYHCKESFEMNADVCPSYGKMYNYIESNILRTFPIKLLCSRICSFDCCRDFNFYFPRLQWYWTTEQARYLIIVSHGRTI